jgi:hypothetical protein
MPAGCIFLSIRLTPATPLDVAAIVPAMETRCPLDDVLDLLRVRGAVMANLRACGRWGISIPPTSRATLHAVTAGSCWVRVKGQPPIEQLPGDVVLLPTGGRAHRGERTRRSHPPLDQGRRAPSR